MFRLAALLLWLAPFCPAAESPRAETPRPPAGPRGPVGPDVPLPDAEAKALSNRVTVDPPTAGGIQAACDRAAKNGTPAVFLPRGTYEMDATVRVPGGVTVLGEGAQTRCRARGKAVHLFRVDANDVRFTRLTLQGADTSIATTNNTFGIEVAGGSSVRIDHCELLGFSYATTFSQEATAQVDHCHIHDNLRNGLGYGVALYSGAHVLVADNAFAQNRHSLASNGDLDWSSGRRLGRFVHRTGRRKTHWQLVHNRLGSNDRSPYELCAVDTHPGMDGTFVVEANLFENLRHGVGIRDGSGRIRRNVFRNLRTKTDFRPLIGVSISSGRHNNIPVEGCMPHHVEVRDNVFEMRPGAKVTECQVGKAENVTIDGKRVEGTSTDRPAPAIPTLRPMPGPIPR